MRNILLFVFAALTATSASADEIRVITTPVTPGCCGWTVIAIGGSDEAKPASKPDTPRPPKKTRKTELGDCVAVRDKAVADLATCTTARTKAETDLAALWAKLKECQDAGKLYDPVAIVCVDKKPAPASATRAVRGRAPAPAASVPAGEDITPFSTRSRAGGAQ